MRKDSTLSFFEQRRPDAIEHQLPIIPTPPHRLPYGTLSWGRNEGAISWDDAATSIILATHMDAVFFLDSSFLHRHEIPEKIFAALLSRTIAITPRIWSELHDWLVQPFANEGFREHLINANSDRTSGILFEPSSEWPEELLSTARYYIALLSTRKYYGVSLKQSTGGSKNDDQITARLQSFAGDRGAALARKGLADHGKANFTTDEDLVVTAVMYAIHTGREVCILTRDRDVLEQFRKFNYLLDTHYRAHLIGESYATTPENLIVHDPLPVNPDKAFGMTQLRVLDLPRRFTEWLVPSSSHRIDVSCHRFAGEGERMKFASLHFGAIREMSRLLAVKGMTGGRNYETSDGRNCHLVVSPPFAPHLSGCAVLAKDEDIHYGDFYGPSVDIEYAVQEVQRFRRALVDPAEVAVPGGTPGMQLADFFLKERLGLSCESKWSSFSWRDFATAVRHFDAAATFVIDAEVFESLPAEIRPLILERYPRWSTQVREASIARARELLSPKDVTAFESIPGIDIRSEAPHDLGYGHYLALLALRKQFATIIRQRVQNEHGRVCRNGEAELIAAHYGGERARRLAMYGERGAQSAELFAGDELLVWGTIAGVMSGADVVFLTRDPAFMDQLAKLGGLLSADYVASQYGRRRNAHAALSPDVGANRDPVSDVVGHAVAQRLSSDWKRELLPLDPYLINIQCWLLGNSTADGVRLSVLNYCAERGMHNLLSVKGATGGRNVESLDGRNIRAGFLGDEAIITVWRDRYLPIGCAEFPLDERLDHRVSRVAAADTVRVHMNEDDVTLPWHE